jgi:F-type H+-transporting ATPase subunit b
VAAGAVAARDAHEGDGTEQGAPDHDPFDLSHANAGPGLEDVSEIRSSLALWTLVVFALLLAVLWKFAWGPISEALDRRQQLIEGAIASAQRQHEQAMQLLAQHEAKLAGAADEVRRIVDEARRDADQQRQKIIAEAQHVALAEKERAVQEIHTAKNSALEQLAQKSVDMAVDLAGKIVRRQLNPQDDAALIGEALKQFPSQN